MDPITQQTTLAAAGGKKDPLYVDDVFSTFLYDGTSSALTITNGIDLSGEGGLVWTKRRNILRNNILVDSERGTSSVLKSDSTNGAANQPYSITMNSDGYTWSGTDNDVNVSGSEYCSWTFRKAKGFFDVVTWSGTNTNRDIAHNLGSVPGMVIVKRTDSGDSWYVYHRSHGATKYLELNLTGTGHTSSATWNNTTPTSSVFTVGSFLNANGATYVAYVFAHDDQSFGDDGDESIIKCGSYTGTASDANKITLGFEPQWLLIKNINDNGADWVLLDIIRGANSGYGRHLRANLNAIEYSNDDLRIDLHADGFSVNANNTMINGSSGNTFIYIAIRRPNKPPETAAECFDVFSQAGSSSTQLRPGTSGSSVTDLALIKRRDTTGNGIAGARLTGQYSLRLNGYDDQATSVFGATDNTWDQMSGTKLQFDSDTNTNTGTFVNYHFTRKPGFFDVVAYAGHQYRDASTNISSVPHNLGVVPEMIWIKSRNLSSSSSKWVVYHKDLGTSSFGVLNLDETTSTNYFLGNTPTNSVFKLFAGGFSTVDTSGNNYVAYLFATLPGISKVGSFTGDGTSNRTIDCGFTAGARFVMIKRTDSSASWFVFDSARGIVSGNDPYFVFNQDSAEVSSTDFIDPNNVGFEIDTNHSDINASGGSYIFYAIA